MVKQSPDIHKIEKQKILTLVSLHRLTWSIAFADALSLLFTEIRSYVDLTKSAGKSQMACQLQTCHMTSASCFQFS